MNFNSIHPLVTIFIFYWCFYLCFLTFFFLAYFLSWILLIFFSFQTSPETIIISLAIPPVDMLILQKEQSPTAQHQQIILCKSSFHHLETLYYATEAHKFMQVKVETWNLKGFLNMFSHKNAFKIFFHECVEKVGLFVLARTFHPPFNLKTERPNFKL